jgi:transketolase
MSAPHHGLDNLVAIVDRNRIQNDRWTDEVMTLEPLGDKWRAFGWDVVEVDGHSVPELLTAFDRAAETKGRPTVVIAHTSKGKGVSFMENNADFHGKAPSPEQLERALAELASN